MKGIILSGGSGTRLYPLTAVVNKQLLPVYDKPMVYYPLTTLMRGGVREVCVISSPSHIQLYRNLFGSGRRWGMTFEYIIQEKPEGLSQAFILAEKFINNESSVLVLGDNIFHGSFNQPTHLVRGAHIYGYAVQNPKSYGVVEIDKDGFAISIEEKPLTPKSNYAIPGLYYFDRRAPEFARQLTPSERGELEITDLIKEYLEAEGKLFVDVMPRGTAWLDAGTSTTLFQAAAYVQSVQERTGVMIGCPEEVALQQGFIDKQQFQSIVNSTPKSEYRLYLEKQL